MHGMASCTYEEQAGNATYGHAKRNGFRKLDCGVTALFCHGRDHANGRKPSLILSIALEGCNIANEMAMLTYTRLATCQ
jgi:hypothetical protein